MLTVEQTQPNRPDHVNVLGEFWNIYYRKKGEDKTLQELHLSGYTDYSARMIVIELIEPDEKGLEDIESIYRHVLRHEIIHAFLYESGLCGESELSGTQINGEQIPWSINEQCVDWFAYQGIKIYAAWEQVGAAKL